MESHGNLRPPRYVSFLLRLWETFSDGQWVWRCSLEDPLTGRQHSFKDIQRLIDFLNKQIEIDALHEKGGDSQREIDPSLENV